MPTTDACQSWKISHLLYIYLYMYFVCLIVTLFGWNGLWTNRNRIIWMEIVKSSKIGCLVVWFGKGREKLHLLLCLISVIDQRDEHLSKQRKRVTNVQERTRYGLRSMSFWRYNNINNRNNSTNKSHAFDWDGINFSVVCFGCFRNWWYFRHF